MSKAKMEEFDIALFMDGECVAHKRVRGYIVNGTFGIDQICKGVWRITHLRTGCKLGQFADYTSRAAAMRVAQRASDWRAAVWRHGRFGNSGGSGRAPKWLTAARGVLLAVLASDRKYLVQGYVRRDV